MEGHKQHKRLERGDKVGAAMLPNDEASKEEQAPHKLGCLGLLHTHQARGPDVSDVSLRAEKKEERNTHEFSIKREYPSFFFF
jgi:hypothetical protein